MIISRTPYRVSFAGGGTDLPAYCDREPGLVLSCTIRPYLEVTVEPGRQSKPHDPHVQACLDFLGIHEPTRVLVTSSIAGGTGLGSSSALTVGTLRALHAYRGENPHPHRIAEEACAIELDVMGKPIGRQDQYACAYGGLNTIAFHPRGVCGVESLICRERHVGELQTMLSLWRIGGARKADEILVRQSEVTASRMGTLRSMRDSAFYMADALKRGDFPKFAAQLRLNWLLKRSLGCGISNPTVDAAYDAAIAAGAWGGKLLGAGGGGYLLVMAPFDVLPAIREALEGCEPLPFSIDRKGSRILTNAEALCA